MRLYGENSHGANVAAFHTRKKRAMAEIITLPAVGVRSIAMSVPVCLFVCLSARISKKLQSKLLGIFLYVLSVALARSSSDNNGIRYVLPVLWMTSCFPVTAHMARDIGSIDVSAVLKQVVKFFSVFTRGRHAV